MPPPSSGTERARVSWTRALGPTDAFVRRFGRAPAASAWAPGAVLCLHGGSAEHGEALFVSVPLGASVQVAPREDDAVRSASHGDRPTHEPGDGPVSATADVDVTMVVAAMRASGIAVGGLDVLIEHELPGRAGFGTGAARRVALVRAIAALVQAPLDDAAVALLASRDGGATLPRLTEVAAASGHPGQWLLVDIANGTTTVVPMPDTAEIALVASGSWRRPDGWRRLAAAGAVEPGRVRAATRALHASALQTVGAIMQARSGTREAMIAADDADLRAEHAWADPRVFGARAWRARGAGGILALCRRGAAKDVARLILARDGRPHVLWPQSQGGRTPGRVPAAS